ncbi:MAG: amidohydrolase family protein [Halanaerobiaceae bacterium]
MIIDADVHITPYEKENGMQIDDLLYLMDKNEVDKALTWLQPPYLRKVAESNEYVYKAMKNHQDRILGFGWADPNLGVEKAREESRKCIEEYGFYGVKLNGAQNSFRIDDPEISLPVIEEIAKYGKCLAFHVGGDAVENTHPFRVAKIAEKYPQLDILAVHMGGAADPDLADAMIEFAGKYDNITLIGSHVSAVKVLKAVKELGADRVCFGSDSPFNFMRVELAKYNILLEEEVTETEKKKIMGDNMVNLFNL